MSSFASYPTIKALEERKNVGSEDISLRKRVLARDNGVCSKCGLDTVALYQALADVHARWADIVCLPPNLFALMRAYAITGTPRGQSDFEQRRRYAQKVRHPDLGMAGIELDLLAIRNALQIGLLLKPHSFKEWLSGLGKAASLWPKSLWHRDHVIPQGAPHFGPNTLENCQTLCLDCHARKHAKS